MLPAGLPLPGEPATAGLPIPGEVATAGVPLPRELAVAGVPPEAGLVLEPPAVEEEEPPEPVAGEALMAVTGTGLVEEAGVGEAVVGVADGVIKPVTVPEEANGAGAGMVKGVGGGLGLRVEPVPEGVGDDDPELGTGTPEDLEEEENAEPGDKEAVLGLVTEEALEGDGIPEDCPGDETALTGAADEAEDGLGDAVGTAGDVDAVPGDAEPGGVGDAWLAARAAAMLASMASSEVFAGPAKQEDLVSKCSHHDCNDS